MEIAIPNEDFVTLWIMLIWWRGKPNFTAQKFKFHVVTRNRSVLLSVIWEQHDWLFCKSGGPIADRS